MRHRIEHGLQRRHLAGETAVLLFGPDALEPVARHLADAHHGASRHGAALDLEPFAVGAVRGELEALAALPQALDGLLQTLRVRRGQPLRVAEDAARSAGADHHADVAFDLGLAMGGAPGDDHLPFPGHEDLGALQLGLQFADLGVLRGQPPPPAVPSRDVERRGRRREEEQADEDEPELVAHVHHDRLPRIARQERKAQADVLGDGGTDATSVRKVRRTGAQTSRRKAARASLSLLPAAGGAIPQTSVWSGLMCCRRVPES